MLPVYMTVALDVFLILLAIGVFMFSKRKIRGGKIMKKAKSKVTIPGSEEVGAPPMITSEPIEAQEIAESPEI